MILKFLTYPYWEHMPGFYWGQKYMKRQLKRQIEFYKIKGLYLLFP